MDLKQFKMFKGSIVALITPMKNNNSIDRISFKNLIEYHINSGTSAILVTGTTGEVLSLRYKEYINIVNLAIEFSDNRIPIIVGINTSSTDKAISLIKYFNTLNVSCYLVGAPHYNCPGQEGIYLHFKYIAENSYLPIILYNVPSRTGCDILPKTIVSLSNIRNIIGIKEATGDLNRISQILELMCNDNDFLLFSGNDATALDFIRLGGHGVISVTANIMAKEMAKIFNLAIEGKYVQAIELNKNIMPLHKALFCESNPIPIKWACKKIGLICNDKLRLPMTSLSKKNSILLERIMKKINLI